MNLTRVREARGRVSLLPRWVHRAYASVAGYFWLPCALCGRRMGGHEWRSVDGRPDSIPDGGPGATRGICPVCSYEGRADRRPALGGVAFNPMPRPLSEHCRPGRCLALTCCSYECSRGRCPSIPEEFRKATP